MGKIFILFETQKYNLIGILIGLSGIIMAWIFYRKSRRLKEPFWAVRNRIIIEGYSAKLSGLDITYNGNSVKDLSIARIAFWNNGKDTLDAHDVAIANPIKIVMSEGREILDIKPIVVSNQSSLFNVAVDTSRKYAIISFDYIDQGQGAIFQIVHTGVSNKDIDIQGDIKGAKIKNIIVPTPKFYSMFPYGGRIKPSVGRIILAAMFIIMATIMLFLPYIQDFRFTPNILSKIMLIIISVMYSVLLLFMAIFFLRRRIPSSLIAFEDEPIF